MRKKITIRIATSGDAQAVLDVYAPYVEKTAVTFEYEVPTRQDFANRMEQTLKKYPYLVAEADGNIAGYAYAGPFHGRAAYDWAVETTVYVDETMKKMGIGGKLYGALEKILSLQHIVNLNACIACPAKDDEYLTRDSINFHQHLGYREVGEFYQCGYKFKRWYNVMWMEKHIGMHVAEQEPIHNFDAVRDSVTKLCLLD